jgi:uncharacterized protein YceK
MNAQIGHRVLGIALIAFLLSGCATTTKTSVATNTVVCQQWRAVSWSKADTDRTLREVKSNNAARAAWCR